MLSALKVKYFFQHWPNFAIFLRIFFTNSENTTKSKFRQETLDILSALKFKGSHLAFYEWKVSFNLISQIFFPLGEWLSWITVNCFSKRFLEPYRIPNYIYRIQWAPSQKLIVSSPNDNWTVFHRRVLFIHIRSGQVAKLWKPLRKGQHVCQYVLEGHLEKGALRALWLMAALWEGSFALK